MLADVLGVVRPLTLWLQRSPAHADVTQLSSVVNHVVEKLRFLSTRDPELVSNFTEGELKKLNFTAEAMVEKCEVIDEAVESLPAASRLRNNSQRNTHADFKQSDYEPFIDEIASEIESTIAIDPVSAAFRCLDVRFYPNTKSDLALFGVEDMQVLTEHFGEAKEGVHPKTKKVHRCDPKISKNEAMQEFENYKKTAFDVNSERTVKMNNKITFQKKKLGTTLTTVANKKKTENIKSEISKLEEQIDNMSLQEIYDELAVPGKAFLNPNILVLLEMAILCPIGNATVERLFSLLKLVKTKLRSLLGDGTLDSLLRIKMECKEELEDHHLEEIVDMFKVELVEKSKSGEIRIDI